ncbi:hypothetical protein ABPG74_010327 [Tetrahymena malaccensis]
MRALVDNRRVNRLSFREFIEMLDIVDAQNFINIFSNYIPLERGQGGYQFKDSASTIHSNCNSIDLCRKIPSCIKFSGTQIVELVNYSYNKLEFIKSAVNYDHIYSISTSKVKDILKQISDESQKLQCLQILEKCTDKDSSASDILEQFKNDEGKQKAAKILRINYEPANKNTNQSSSAQNNQSSLAQNKQNSSAQINQNSFNNNQQKNESNQKQPPSKQNFEYQQEQEKYSSEEEEEIQKQQFDPQDYALLEELKKQINVKQQEYEKLYEKSKQESVQINLSDQEYIEINKKAMKKFSNLKSKKLILLKYELLMSLFQKIPKLIEDYIVFTSNMVQVMERQLNISQKKGIEKEIYKVIYITQHPEYQKLISDYKACNFRIQEEENRKAWEEAVKEQRAKQLLKEAFYEYANGY